MNTNSIANLQQTHLAIWNEKDRARRDALIPTVYASDLQMFDKDFVLNGSKEVSDFIDKLFAQDPGFSFAPDQPMEPVQNGVRFAWKIRTGGNDLTGMDFFLLEDGLVKLLYVFMDPVSR